MEEGVPLDDVHSAMILVSEQASSVNLLGWVLQQKGWLATLPTEITHAMEVAIKHAIIIFGTKDGWNCQNTDIL
jgi:hypothetical protein